MNDKITQQKLAQYFAVTGKAIELCSGAMDNKRMIIAKDFLDMAKRYYSDAKYFQEKKDYVLAFGALNYAHGWLDAGARIGLFDVHDSTLFTVDDK